MRVGRHAQPRRRRSEAVRALEEWSRVSSAVRLLLHLAHRRREAHSVAVRRPLGLALTARGRSDGNDAEELEHLAAKALADADLIERGSGCLTVPVPAALQQPLGNSNYRSPAILKTRIRDLAHVACWPLTAAAMVDSGVRVWR
jgi:hypothetical protein